MKHVMWLMILLIPVLSFAQNDGQLKINDEGVNKNEIKPLTIGDEVPDIFFHHVLNYKSKTARLSDFRGKLVILDMWSVFCTSCIAGFPKMEQLQKEFGDKIQILLVNPHDAKYDSGEKINTTLNKLKTRTGFYPSLPIPIHDSILNTYFPHKSVPHQVWIDGDGKVLAITGSKDVIAQNIQALLHGNEINMPVKNDWAFDRTKPLLFDGNGGDPNDFVYRSLFTGYKEGVGFGSGVRRGETGDVIGVYVLNKPLRQFVSEAYSHIFSGTSSNRIVLNVKNPDQFQWEFNPDYVYCYDLAIPPTPRKIFDKKKYLQVDLSRFFNISVYKEKRRLVCLVLKATDKITSSFTKYDKLDLDLDKSSIKKYIHNHPIERVIKLLDRFNKPLIDETGLTKNIDIDFPDHFDLSNQEELLQFLRQIGFAIKEEERELEVVVITDK